MSQALDKNNNYMVTMKEALELYKRKLLIQPTDQRPSTAYSIMNNPNSQLLFIEKYRSGERCVVYGCYGVWMLRLQKLTAFAENPCADIR